MQFSASAPFFKLKETAIKLWWVEHSWLPQQPASLWNEMPATSEMTLKQVWRLAHVFFCTFFHHCGATSDACCGARTSLVTTTALSFLHFLWFFSCRLFQLYGCMRDISLPSHAQLMGVFAWVEHKIHKVLQPELHRLIIWGTENFQMVFTPLKYV